MVHEPGALTRSGEWAGTVLDQRALHRALTDGGDALVSPSPTGDLLAQLVDNTIDAVSDVAAGVSLIAGADNGLQVFTASDPAVERIHRDRRTRRGPGHEAFTTRQPVRCDDLTDEQRWPAYRAAVLDAGFRAVACVPLQLGEGNGGVLEMYATSPRGWSDADIEAAELLVDVAVGYIRIARELDNARTLAAQLQHALDSRIVIEQAKGIIAQARHKTVSDAFELLRAHARNHNRPIHDIARDVVDGQLDPERFDPPTTASPVSRRPVPHRAGAALAPSNLARLLDAVREGVVLVDPSGLIQLVNEPARTLTGYQRSELIGHPVEILLPERAQVPHRQHRADYQRSGNPTRAMGQGPDITLRRADGTEVSVDISLAAIDTPQGPLVVASVRDVTDTAAAEGTVTPDLGHWRTIAEQIDLFVVELDLDGRVRHVNAHTLTVTGYTADQIVGADWFQLMVPDQERDELHEVFRDVLDQRDRSHIHHNLITTADGRLRLTAWINTLTRDHDGEVTGVLSVGRDITNERQRLLTNSR